MYSLSIKLYFLYVSCYINKSLIDWIYNCCCSEQKRNLVGGKMSVRIDVNLQVHVCVKWIQYEENNKMFSAAFYLYQSSVTLVWLWDFFSAPAVESLCFPMAVIDSPPSQCTCVCPSRLFVNQSHADSSHFPIFKHTMRHTPYCVICQSI